MDFDKSDTGPVDSGLASALKAYFAEGHFVAEGHFAERHFAESEAVVGKVGKTAVASFPVVVVAAV